MDSEGDEDPKLPPLDFSSTQTALNYFNNTYFFKNDGDRISFVNRLDDNEDEKQILSVALDKFFQMAFARDKEDGVNGLGHFFANNIYGCRFQKVLEAYNEWKEIKDIENLEIDVDDLPRMVDVDFQIKDSNLSHRYDLDCFSDRIDDLISSHENAEERMKYVAPYFCFIQSSGMGKTKILYEYQQMSYKQKGVASFLVIGTDAMKGTTSTFPKLDLANVGPRSEKEIKDMTESQVKVFSKKVASRIFATLDKELMGLITKHPHGNDVQKVALLFDESQYLLKDEFGEEAFRFRCIRRWLMEKPRKGSFRSERRLTVVAVFTGTSTKLTNVLFESDSDLAGPEYPSRFFVPPTREYYRKGRMLHRPFTQTTTMGSCRDLINSTLRLSEYEHAAYRGRPLFAQMAKEGILHENIPAILLRMLRVVNWQDDNRNGWINILATRMQLGQVSADVAADLVANAYANLCSYNSDSRLVRLGYLTDPVLARLAMGMMDGDFRVNGTIGLVDIELVGQNKTWWTEKLFYLLSNEMVRPDKGDSGEISVALYMLFCGDLIRKAINFDNKRSNPGAMSYSQFSVSLDAWLQVMISGGKLPDAPIDDCEVSVGFIQVCRNPLRWYSDSWRCFKEPDFLKYIYESGIAFYTCNNCAMIDMVVPLRIKSNVKGSIDGFCYVPMLISIKSRQEFTQSEADAVFRNMTKRAKADGLERALCFLIVFGSSPGTKPFEGNFSLTNDSVKVSDQLMNGIVMKAMRVPYNDEFGLSAAFNAKPTTAQLEADLFASHDFLNAHTSDGNLTAPSALYSGASVDLINKFKSLWDALKKNRG